jgi:DNA-binding transcriptional MerR regulator
MLHYHCLIHAHRLGVSAKGPQMSANVSASTSTGGAAMTVDELAAAAGVSVRTVRFYAGKHLLPPPELQGRLGLYSQTHLARLELVRDLQARGFTLSAIENYLQRVPSDATPEDVAVFRALLSPWVADTPVRLDRAGLDELAGRPLDNETVERLTTLRFLEPVEPAGGGDGEIVEVRPAELEIGLQLVALPAPVEMFLEARDLLDRHTTEMAEELSELVRRHLVRPYLERELEQEERVRLSRVIEQLKPLTIQTVVAAFSRAVDRVVRRKVEP